MKRIYLASDPVSANVLKIRLEDAGIPAVVQDERTFELRGEVGLAFPSVWVANEQEAEARTIALNMEHPKLGASWTCPRCGEVMDATFSECWECAPGGAATEISKPPPASASKGKLFYALIAIAISGFLFVLHYAYTYDACARHYAAAVAFHEQEQYDAAIEEYDKVLALNPKSTEAWTSRGYAWYSKKDFPRAITDLDKALQLNPRLNGVYEFRAYAHLEVGHPTQALNDYVAAASERPFGDDLKMSILYCKFEIGDIQGAMYDAEKLRDSANFKYESALYRSSIYNEQSESTKAMNEVELAISLDPLIPEAYIEKAQLLADQNEFERALAVCDYAQGYCVVPNPRLHATRGIILAKLNRREDMRKEMEKILLLDLKTRYDIPVRLIAHMLLGSKTAANQDMLDLLKSSPESRWSYINAAAAVNLFSRELDPQQRAAAQEKALDYLDQAKARGFINWRIIKEDFFLKELASHPRFKKLSGLP